MAQDNDTIIFDEETGQVLEASASSSTSAGSSVGVGSENAPGADMHNLTIPEELSILPLREMVIFPVLVTPLAVQREASVRLIDEAVSHGDRIIGVAAMPDSSVEKPTAKDIYPIGCAVVIRMMAKANDGIRMIVQGVQRVEILQITQDEPYLKARVRVLAEGEQPAGGEQTDEQRLQVEALRRQIANTFQRIVQLSPQMPDELSALATQIDDPAQMTDLIAAHMPISTPEKQEVLASRDLPGRMTALLNFLAREVQVLELGSKLQNDVSSEINKTQREYYLREQIKAIQKELGEGGEGRGDDIAELRAKIAEAGMPEDAEREATRELDRLERMSPGSPEVTVARTYIDWLIGLPWSEASVDNLDINEVARVLDEDHFGLEKVKDRILEYLSVRKFKPEGAVRQPILCLVGPPGVGKTSLGRSIARAMGKKFYRLSLGGVRDEAEIRGHRRTYIGALPGQIIQGLKRAGTSNPLFILDEIDKVTADFRGDPSSALLEVLDPEQNSTFRDNYLDVPFDLSKVLFMTTANMLDTIQPALRDRMEIIEIAGYTQEEKTQIARQHLIPKELAEHGLTADQLDFTDEGILALIAGHTREAGVRSLERQVAAVCRKATREFAQASDGDKAAFKVTVDAAQVAKYLGSPRFEHEEARERASIAGVATGLVWTPVGGDIIFIESSRAPGGKGLQLTGQLGDVMRESAQAALSYLRAHAEEHGITPDFYERGDLHIHVPAGAIPKDGPSAGVTMTTALASLLTGRPVRPLLAMTGEVTLSGKVLPVGGIKEKVLAARRAGIKTIILPERNRKDLYEDIPDKLRADINFLFATDVREVLHAALLPPSKDDIREHAGDLEQLDESTRPLADVAGTPDDNRMPGDGGNIPTGINVPSRLPQITPDAPPPAPGEPISTGGQRVSAMIA